jgi:hypothetical protein
MPGLPSKDKGRSEDYPGDRFLQGEWKWNILQIALVDFLKTHIIEIHTREIPRNKRNSNTDRLLDRKDPSARSSRHLHCSLHTLGLASKPPSETQSIVELALRFRQRLASLVGNNVGQVVAVLADQRVPFEQALGAGPGADFAEGLEGLVGGGDGCIGVLGLVVGGCGPYFAVAWVCCMESW